MAEPTAFKYRAFISYSHADTKWAKWLHRALESFRIDKDLIGRKTAAGTIPKALRPIFRDRDDFSAGHSLTDQTLAALDASAGLVVICSPSAAMSQYVNEEIRLFKSRHPERPIVPLIVDGEPGEPERECFPRALRFAVDAKGEITNKAVELLAADAREEGDGKSLALAKVVAGLLGVSSDDIFRRAERDRRTRQRNWIAGLSGVAVVLAGLAIWAEFNRREAVVQRAEAEHNFEVAKGGANALIFDIAQALREQEGMRSETVRKILGTAEQVIGKLVARSPDNLEVLRIQEVMLNEFANTYAAQGDTPKQEDAALKALTIAGRLAKAEPENVVLQRDLYVACIKVGEACLARGNLDEALNAYQCSQLVAGHLAELDPDDLRGQRDVSVSYDRVGDVLKAQGKLGEALQAYRDSLAIAERLAASDLSNAGWQHDLVVSYSKVGNVLRTQGNLPEALQAYRASHAVAECLAASEPGNAEWQRALAVAHSKVGDVLLAQGDLAGALDAYRDDLAIASHLAKTDPSNAEWQRDLAISHGRVAEVLARQGEPQLALAEYRKGRDIIVRLKDQAPGNATLPKDLAWLDYEIAKLEQAGATAAAP